MERLIRTLQQTHSLTRGQYAALIANRTPALAGELAARAAAVRREQYGDAVYIRGLIEFTNHCKNDCFYCGIRRSNRCVQRYRLREEEILDCCREGYRLGCRTFVLQGGEDPHYTPDRIADLVGAVKTSFSDCAVTLSVGEQPRAVYEQWFRAGADRYLLRQETADEGLYSRLHPKEQTLQNRLRCLQDLKDIGYQVGCGFLVGAPGQTPEHIAEDLKFMEGFKPHMVGIGPFIPQKDTPLGGEAPGSAELTAYLLSILRLMLPDVLLPATTALATLHPRGREMGFLAGANVCMPNLTPPGAREQYALYDHKRCTGDEAAEGIEQLKTSVRALGLTVVTDRGDHIPYKKKEL